MCGGAGLQIQTIVLLDYQLPQAQTQPLSLFHPHPLSRLSDSPFLFPSTSLSASTLQVLLHLSLQKLIFLQPVYAPTQGRHPRRQSGAKDEDKISPPFISLRILTLQWRSGPDDLWKPRGTALHHERLADKSGIVSKRIAQIVVDPVVGVLGVGELEDGLRGPQSVRCSADFEDDASGGIVALRLGKGAPGGEGNGVVHFAVDASDVDGEIALVSDDGLAREGHCRESEDGEDGFGEHCDRDVDVDT